jgi:uncharacterized protein (DUF58 family)
MKLYWLGYAVALVTIFALQFMGVRWLWAFAAAMLAMLLVYVGYYWLVDRRRLAKAAPDKQQNG